MSEVNGIAVAGAVCHGGTVVTKEETEMVMPTSVDEGSHRLDASQAGDESERVTSVFTETPVF